ncbi:MAG: hypothetical protein N2D54_12185 [Chloroflexota bacterium]
MKSALKKIVSLLLQVAIDFLDNPVTKNELQNFIINKISQLSQPNIITGLPAKSQYEFNLTVQNAIGAKLLSADQVQSQDNSDPKLDLDISTWMAGLPKSGVISPKGLIPGSIRNLLALINQNSSEYTAFVSDNFERLLRHVEVRREASLFLNPKADVKTTWLEKHAVSIAFSSYSRKSKDPRFINAALKLNGWAYAQHANMNPGSQLIRYLLALSEAEITVKELFS